MGKEYVLTIFDPESETNITEHYIFNDKKKGLEFLKGRYNKIYKEWKQDERPEDELFYIDEDRSINPETDTKHSMIFFIDGGRIDFFFGIAREPKEKDIDFISYEEDDNIDS